MVYYIKIQNVIKASLKLGDIYYKKKQFKKAIEVYSEALKYRVNDYDLYYNLGMNYIRLNDFSKCRNML